MIPHVHLPPNRINEERSAFARGPRERQLRIIVDRATAPAGEALDLLLRFAGHPLVEVLSTRAEGLPRLAVSPIDPATDQARTIITRPAGPTNYSAVRSASRALRLADELLQASPTIADREEVIRVLLLAFAAAECYGADALVTGSPILLDRTIQRSGAAASNAMTVAEGLALLGLHLRLRGDFTMDRGPGYRGSIDRGLFYWDLARALLPSAWQCSSGAQQYGQATGNDSMFQLVLSAITRLGNSLRARDYLHGQLKLVQTHDTADDALFYLDTFLVFMVGAFDTIARVAHLAYGLNPKKLRRARWRDDKDWRPTQLQPVALRLHGSWTSARRPAMPWICWRCCATGSMVRPCGRSASSVQADSVRASCFCPRTRKPSCWPSSPEGEATILGGSARRAAWASPWRWTDSSKKYCRRQSQLWTSSSGQSPTRSPSCPECRLRVFLPVHQPATRFTLPPGGDYSSLQDSEAQTEQL